MSQTYQSISHLYEREAEVYAAFSMDRDFLAQAKALAGLVDSPTFNMLELFAGPAWHSIELARHFGAQVLAVDSSSGMQDAARKAGLRDEQYCVCTLPRLPAKHGLGDFDLVTALRYSIGYLTPDEVEELFANLGAVTSVGAAVILELHDLSLVRQGFSDLAIRERSVQLPDGSRIRTSWPATPPIWEDDEWRLTMEVVVKILRGSSEEVKHYRSSEHMYSVKDIQRLAERSGRFRRAELSSSVAACFPHAKVVLLRRI